MRNLKMKAIMAALMVGMLCSSCVGSFKLFNKMATWNKDATNSKFLNELIYLLISPAYAVCCVVDALVLNTIEFWSGSNPLAMHEGVTKQLKGEDGKMYAVTYLKNGYEVVNEAGEKLLFTYDEKQNAWSLTQNGATRELFRFNEDGTVKAELPNGQSLDVAMNDGGLYEVRMAVNSYGWYAQR